MHSSIWYYTMNLKWLIVNVKGSPDIISKLQSWRIVFILSNSAGLAEMPGFAGISDRCSLFAKAHCIQ